MQMPRSHLRNSCREDLHQKGGWNLVIKVLATILLSEEGSLRQVSLVAQLCPALWDPMDCSTLGFPVHHQLLEFAQTHVHRVGDTMQPSHPLPSPSPPTFNLSQHQSLFQVSASASVLPMNIQDWFPLRQVVPFQRIVTSFLQVNLAL